MKSMNFEDEIPSIPIDNSKNHYEPVFDLISLNHAFGIFRYQELNEEPLKLGLNFAFLLEHVTELNVMTKRMTSVAIDNFGVAEKIV